MNTHSHPRFSGLLALAAALAMPAAFAQDTTAAAADEAQAEGKTPITASQLAQPAKKTWADLDTDKDGKLSKHETETIPALQAVFDEADANADGALTGEEYKAYLAVHDRNAAPPAAPPKR